MFTLLNILKWSARILSIICITLIILFMFGDSAGSARPNITEFIGLILFPVGVAAGMIISFKKPGLGAIISLSSLFLFYMWHYISTYSFPQGPWFLAFTLPAFLFLIYYLFRIRHM